MGITIKIAGSNFSKYITKPLLPIRNGLVGEYYFGSKEADNLKNWANESVSLLPVGVITQGDYSASFLSAVAGFRTTLVETAEFTVGFLGGVSGEATSLLVQNQGAGIMQSGLQAFKSEQEIYPCWSSDNNGVAANFVQNFVAAPDVLSNPRLVIGRSEGAAGGPFTIKSDFWRAGVKKSAVKADTDQRTLGSPHPWSIGYSPNPGALANGTTVTARHAFIYNRSLSDAEADEVADFLLGYYADRGVTI